MHFRTGWLIPPPPVTFLLIKHHLGGCCLGANIRCIAKLLAAQHPVQLRKSLSLRVETMTRTALPTMYITYYYCMRQ